MTLRIVMSVSMLLPALPVKAEYGECPFMSFEECREWLAACCGARDLAESGCGSVCEEGDAVCAASCGSECDSAVSCCLIELNESGVDACTIDLTCPSDNVACNGNSESEEEGVCLWCVCCPIGRPRPPEQRPAPVTQRSEPEKHKAGGDSGCRRIDLPASLTTFAVLDREVNYILPDSRQALLCIWRN